VFLVFYIWFWWKIFTVKYQQVTCRRGEDNGVVTEIPVLQRVTVFLVGTLRYRCHCHRIGLSVIDLLVNVRTVLFQDSVNRFPMRARSRNAYPKCCPAIRASVIVPVGRTDISHVHPRSSQDTLPCPRPRSGTCTKSSTSTSHEGA
jgi:hypothetical protein